MQSYVRGSLYDILPGVEVGVDVRVFGNDMLEKLSTETELR